MLGAVAVAAAVAVPVVSWGATFGAQASVDPLVQYLRDSGTVLTFTVHNTGDSDSIGAVQISRPSSSFTVAACPEAPAGWTTQAASGQCRYRSSSGTADDIQPGESEDNFQLTSGTAGGKADYSGTWKVVVSKTNQFDNKSTLAAAASEPPGLTVKVHSFEILDAVVASAPATPGSACPAPNKQAIGGATHVIVICGKNRANGTLTPTAAQSSLAGTFIASAGTFSSGPIAGKSSSSRVLGNWSGSQVSGTKGTGKTVIAKVGASSAETSPLTTLTGYEITNQAPTADAKTVTGVAEDGSKSIELSGDDADGDPLQFSVVSGPSNGSLGTIDSLSCSSATPNHCTASVLYTPDANFNGSDSFTYKVSDGFSDSIAQTVSITVDPVNDTPSASGTSTSLAEDGSKLVDLGALVADVETADADLSYEIVSDPSDGDLSGSGSSRTYTPDPDFNGTDSFTYKVTDRGDPDNCGAAGPGCDAAESSTTETISITVTAVNDAPVNVVPAGPVAAIQDTDTPLTGISIGDIDAGSDDVELELSVDHGILTVDTTVLGGIGLLQVAGNGSATVTITASLAQINATLAATDGLVYHGDAPYTGADTLTVTTDDLGHNGSGGALTDTDTLAITVSPPNAAPVADGKSVTTGEDTAKTITLSASDADGDDPLSFDTGDPSHGSIGTVGAVTCDHGTPTNSCSADVTYTPDPDYNGPDSFTYTANDGTVDSAPATVSITVTPVNDAPAIAGIEAGALAYTENDPATAITSTATVSDIDSADFDTGTLTVDYSVGGTADDRLEIQHQGSGPGQIGVSGSTVSFAGTAIGSFTGGSGTTPLVVTFDADATPAAVQALVRAVTYRNVSENPSEVARTARFVVTDGDGGTSAAATRAIAVTAVHDAPALAGIEAGALSYTENDASIAITSTLTVTDVDSNVTGATVTIGNLDTGDELIFVNTASITGVYNSGTGVLTLSGNASAADYQTALRSVRYRSTSENPSTTTRTITFQVKDGPDPSNLSNTQSRDIAVTAVNDTPVVTTTAAALAYTENDPATTVDPGLTVADAENNPLSGGSASITANFQTGQDSLSWTDNNLADNIALDAINSSAQTIALTGIDTVANYQAALRAVKYANSSEAPTTSNRTVTFGATDLPGATGTGTRTITVTAVDDPPTAVNDSATVLEDAAATSIAVLTNDTDVDGGPKTISSASDPANGTVVLTGGAAGAHTGLTYQPDPNYCNDPPGTTSDTFTYTLNGGSTATVSMTVTCVNDAPVADDETFNGNDSAIGNTTLQVDDPDDNKAAPTNPHTEITGDILAGDTDIDGPGPLTVTPGTFATNDGGSVTIEADGDFVFQPAAATSCTDTSDFFDYTVEDSGSPEQTDTGRVTISIAGCVWYVSNNAAGNSGTSIAPFDTLAQAETASGANHTVFVFDGDNTSTGYGGDGYAMNAGERLIGEHEGLVVDPDQGGSLTADTLYPANPGAHPTLTATSADVIDLDDGNELRGLNIDPSNAGGIAGGIGDTGGGTIDDVNVVPDGTAGTQPGLELSGTAGTFNITNLAVNNNASGISLVNAGTTDFGSTTITSGGPGLSASGTNMSTSSFDSITVTGSANGGVNMTNTTGTTTFGDGIGTDLNLTTTSGTTPAFGLSNAGTVSVPANPASTANVSATGGPAVDVTGTSGATLAFDDVDSTNSASDGVNLAGLVAGTFTANSSSTITNAATIDFDLDGGTGAVTYDGTITDDVGQLVRIANTTGGIKDFNGNITDGGDGDGSGIALTTNTGATIRFDGGLTLATGANAAFAATGGGTLAVTDPTAVGTAPDNTLATTTGTALNVANTTIHANGVNFRSISSNGAGSGIVLNTTGASGGLTVTGNGGSCTSAATCTGGAIQSSTGPGINLTSVGGGVSLTRMSVNSGGDDGVRGASVNGLTLDNARVTSNGNANTENGIDFTQLTGTSPFTNTTVSSNFDSNVFVTNASGVLNLNVTGGAYSGASGGQGDGIFVEGTGTGSQNLNVQGPITFANNVGDHVQHSADADNTTDSDVTINNATMTSPAAAGGGPTCALNILGGGITISHGGNVVGGSNLDATITNNNIQNSCIGAIAVGTSGSVLDQQIAQVDATIQNNVIGTAGVAGSGSVQGNGIFVDSNGNSLVRTLITGNTIRQWTNRSGIALDVLDGDAEMSATIRNNILTEPNSAFAGTTTRGMTIQLGSAQVGDSIDACLDIGHATDATLKNQVAGTGEAPQPDIRYLHEGQGSVVQLAGYSGPAAPTIADIRSYLQPRNDRVATPSVSGISTASPSPSTTSSVVSCPPPAN